MKSGTNAVGLWIVGGVTAMIFSFLWWNIPDLANSLMTVPRFAFYRMVTIAVCCCGLMACFMRSHFSFSLLDWSVLLWTGYVWTRSLMGDMVEYRVRLIVLTVVLYFVFCISLFSFGKSWRLTGDISCVYGICHNGRRLRLLPIVWLVRSGACSVSVNRFFFQSRSLCLLF